MRRTYRVLAALVAVEVAVQASAHAFTTAGMLRYIDGGGVIDKSLAESGTIPFPEAYGQLVHALNGMVVIPLLALSLLVVSFWARVPHASRWAGAVLGLVVLQISLGLGGYSAPVFGALHGLNALALFATAFTANRRARRAVAPAAEVVAPASSLASA